VLKDLITGIKPSLSVYAPVSLDELEAYIKKLVQENKGVSISGLMGDIMKKYRGKIEGSLIMKIPNKYIINSKNLCKKATFYLLHPNVTFI